MIPSIADPEVEWPPRDLEYVGRCPGCDEQGRTLMFDGLGDLAFGVAPGKWTLWRCSGCGAGYLDPRPSESSIGRAYEQYYTHQASDRTYQLSHITGSNLRSRLRVGYYQTRYGLDVRGGWALGGLVASLAPRIRSQWDHYIRHLGPPSAPGARLLDVGCGAGDFLHIARGLGYAALGLEPDKRAAAAATSAGLEVFGETLPDTGLPAGSFEQITLSHVFEHLHKPRAAAEELFRLLGHGGRVWFNQPNIDAPGLRDFGADWRGLEAPRHLFLPNASGLRTLLTSVGFVDVRILPPKPNAGRLYRQSVYMAQGILPRHDEDPPGWTRRWRRRAREAEAAGMRRPAFAECLTMTARKP